MQQTQTKTKTKISVKNKIAIGMISTGAIALAAALILGGKKSGLVVRTNPKTPSGAVNSFSFQEKMAEFDFEAKEEGLSISQITVDFETSGTAITSDLIKNIKLVAPNQNCYGRFDNYGYNNSYGYLNQTPNQAKWTCSLVETPPYSKVIGNVSNVDIKTPYKATVTLTISSLIIPANEKITLAVMADIGKISKNGKIKTSIIRGSSLTAYYMEKNLGDRVIVNVIPYGKWRKLGK